MSRLLNSGFRSYSQYGQDAYVIKMLKNLSNGFFIEAGGADGILGSNTKILEDSYGWQGILIEPTEKQFKMMVENRSKAKCFQACLSSEQKKVRFYEVEARYLSPGSTTKEKDLQLSLAKNIDETEMDSTSLDSKWGKYKRTYLVDSYPLEMILEQANAPQIIDYFSLDVEGFEDEVLMNFPFDRYQFKVLGIENPSEQLNEKLTSLGYLNDRRIGGDIMYLNPSLGIHS